MSTQLDQATLAYIEEYDHQFKNMDPHKKPIDIKGKDYPETRMLAALTAQSNLLAQTKSEGGKIYRQKRVNKSRRRNKSRRHRK
jgi:hypothetical protein